MTFALLALFLFACASPQQTRSYDYCVVERVDEQTNDPKTYGWLAHCDDGSSILFPRIVKEGEQIYYSAYYEDADYKNKRGYIIPSDKVIP